MAELGLIPFHPLRQVGDHPEVIVHEANGARVPASLGPALTRAGAVAAIKRGIDLFLDLAERGLLRCEIVLQAGKLCGRKLCDLFDRESPDVF